MTPSFVARIAVEGDPDEAALTRLIEHAGGIVEKVYGKEGDDFIRTRLEGYNKAAKRNPWCVLVDLNHKAECAPSLRREWLPKPADQMCFRVAVREVEAWFLADPARLAGYLEVSRDHIPEDVESVEYPKRRMVSIARNSSNRDVREDMVPRPESGRIVGPAYNGRLVEFASEVWRPAVAAENCDSVHRALACLNDLATAP